MAATAGKIPHGPIARPAVTQVAAAGGDSVGVRKSVGVGKSPQPCPRPRPARRLGLVAGPGGEPKPLPLPRTAQEELRSGECPRLALRPARVWRPRGSGGMRRVGAQGQDPAGRPGGEPGLHVHLRRPTTPLPPALSSGTSVAASTEICQGIFWFNSRKNIPTGEGCLGIMGSS